MGIVAGEANGVPVSSSQKPARLKPRVKRNLSTKTQDFQIRVRVMEARRLVRDNIHPVCHVTVEAQQRQTRIRHSTSSPYWNEIFFLNFVSSQAELFEELITFKIFNSKKLRSDSFIGQFQCDVGTVYDKPRHALLNTWLLLSDPADNMAGSMGYLKVSICVLGPGDNPPNMKSSRSDKDDIEGNLLKPVGVQLTPSTLTLRLYRGEDIPQMDSGFGEGVKRVLGIGEEKKELVDPYVTFQFAGKKVSSRREYHSESPVYNQELKLGIRFPSMCETVKLTVFDWDKVTADDVIASKELEVSALSSACDEHGFLPTFGPCYINFYGAPREFSALVPEEFNSLNLGEGEGCSYRGRLLVELNTQLGELPEQPVVDIANDDVLCVQSFMRRRHYRLHVAFLSATMVSAVDAPVEFEISIGNYGNKLDNNVPPCSSTTQPTNAVFDGSSYYFLPWGNLKPCVMVDSQWEDISFRLEALNMLLALARNLERHVEGLKADIKAKVAKEVLATKIIAMLDGLIQQAGNPLPAPVPGDHRSNELDAQLAKLREEHLSGIVEGATKLRETATDVEQVLVAVEDFLSLLRQLAHEPQNSIPDVVVWMLSGNRRIAYYRIPAYDVLYASDPAAAGYNCGKVQTLNLKYPGSGLAGNRSMPCHLRLKAWLGLSKYDQHWHQSQLDGELAVFAETYENQMYIPGIKWTNKAPTMGRSKWSDASGKLKLPKDSFVEPQGWRFVGDWYISPEISMQFDRDAGHTKFMEDAFECQMRLPGIGWSAPAVGIPWSDVRGDSALLTKDEFVLRQKGWDWEDVWETDVNRAVDEEGWEYTIEPSMAGWSAVEKRYHVCRRRRWVRQRLLVDPSLISRHEDEEAHCRTRGLGVRHASSTRSLLKNRPTDLDSDDEEEDHTQTAPRMFLSFQQVYKYQLRAYVYQARDLDAGDTRGTSDPYAQVSFLGCSQSTEMVRKTVSPTWDQTLIFEEMSLYDSPDSMRTSPPSIIVEIFDFNKFGKPDMLGRTFAKPTVKLTAEDAERETQLRWYSIDNGDDGGEGGGGGGELLAVFELYLISEEVPLPFKPSKRGALYEVPSGIRPVLRRTAVEVLCWGVRDMKSFQLAAVTSPSAQFSIGSKTISTEVIRSTKKNPNFTNPILFFDVLLPETELYTPPLNIRVRDHRMFARQPTVGITSLACIDKYRCATLPPEGLSSLKLEIAGVDSTDRSGEHIIDLDIEGAVDDSDNDDISLAKLGKTTSKSALVSKSDLTEKLISKKGGITTAKKSMRKKAVESGKLIATHDSALNKCMDDTSEGIDWWSKYYASCGQEDKAGHYLEKNYDTIEIYDTELEQLERFDGFTDFCDSFLLNRGKNLEDEESDVIGQLKVLCKIYPLPEDPSIALPPRYLTSLPPSQPEECLIRVYIICAVDLQPKDNNGLADPYLVVKVGDEKYNGRDERKANTINPIFGQMVELKCVIPLHTHLRMQLWDYDLVSSDDLIGETSIDLESRLLSKHGATCGLPRSYCTSGPNEWRLGTTPMEMLEAYCKRNSMSLPQYYGKTAVKIANRVLNIGDFEKGDAAIQLNLGETDQRLALHVLRQLPLVREHVETRPLYNPIQPGLEQGKLQMWVDIFPRSLGPPGKAVDITPRVPHNYQLRCIIWNTKDVVLDETSITGDEMSDIYVKGWIPGIDEKQKTDVHYRSLDGEGNFNWRYIFPFKYLPAEQSIIVEKKEHFWNLDETETRLPPQFIVQIWDNDKFSIDDFLGSLHLDLTSMPEPAKSAKSCSLKMLSDYQPLPGEKPPAQWKTVSLMDQKRVFGWWPCYSNAAGKDGRRQLSGKVEMTLEIVSGEEIDTKPAGKGRDDPNMNPKLEEPIRPATSFLWFASPFKTLRFILWRNYKWWILLFIIVLLLVIFVILFVYSLPDATMTRLVEKIWQ
ncbi:PREDICTED: dysferlin-like [Priapulus caudatus]|uniref:Dysferlin-like n=1 Tax=Priapulus caudatus TaxID=37621 RepID=A0ABM1EGT6_PRICU|nr:PREDICTED: dysferlin-like [Priapulus caudatus]